MKPLRIAALVKQIPRFEEMQLGPDGRLKRDGVELSMNPYCLRAVSKGVELAQKTGGSCTVISLGPPAAEDVVRWGVAGGARAGNFNFGSGCLPARIRSQPHVPWQQQSPKKALLI